MSVLMGTVWLVLGVTVILGGVLQSVHVHTEELTYGNVRLNYVYSFYW